MTAPSRSWCRTSRPIRAGSRSKRWGTSSSTSTTSTSRSRPSPGSPTDAAAGAAGQLVLRDNRPNPFNPQTQISFDLPSAGPASLRVYDLSGRLVATLVDAPLTAGSHSATWDGTDLNGQAVASGVYLYELRAGARPRDPADDAPQVTRLATDQTNEARFPEKGAGPRSFPPPLQGAGCGRAQAAFATSATSQAEMPFDFRHAVDSA